MENEFVIYDEEGKEYLCEKLFSYENEQRGKQYIFFYPKDDKDNIMVMSFEDDGTMKYIEDGDELKETQEVLDAYFEDPSIKKIID